MILTLGVSVVIVTLNGKQRLLPTLEHLAKQEQVDFDWEVLLIDNNSSDGTVEFAQALWNKELRPCEFRVFLEKKPGTLYARNAGFEKAYYRYVLFCDDDNSLSSNYVKTAYDYIQKNNDIAAVGGKGIPQFPLGMNPPEWTKPHIRFLGCGAQGETTGDITYQKGCLYTAGAIIDRVWIQKLYAGGYQPKLRGRDSKSLVAGEDTELTYALKSLGGKLHYCEEMEFHHVIPSKRLTLDYFKRLYKAMGYSDFILEYYYKKRKKLIFSGILTLLLTIKYAGKYIFNKNEWNKQSQLYYHTQLGRLLAHFKLLKYVF
jgi:glycosyltransferase involved in cell wall biosynthesis